MAPFRPCPDFMGAGGMPPPPPYNKFIYNKFSFQRRVSFTSEFNIDGVRIRILFLFNLFVSLRLTRVNRLRLKLCINRHNLSEKFKTIGHIFYSI